MEVYGSNEHEAPRRKFDDSFAGFLERYRALDLNPETFVHMAVSNFANCETAMAIERVIANTAIAPGDASSLPANHPAVKAFREGALLALEVVQCMYPHNGWDKTIASICKEVTYDTLLTTLEQDAMTAIAGSKRRYMREQMLLRSYAGRKSAANFSQLVPEIASSVHPSAVVDFENGFCFMADAATRHDMSRFDFESQAKYYLELGQQPEEFVDKIVEQILENKKYEEG